MVVVFIWNMALGFGLIHSWLQVDRRVAGQGIQALVEFLLLAGPSCPVQTPSHLQTRRPSDAAWKKRRLL